MNKRFLQENLVISLFIIIMLVVSFDIVYQTYVNHKFSKDRFEKDITISEKNGMTPNSTMFSYRHKATLNNEGFWDNDFTIDKPLNLTRIAVIGDSFTFGFGLEDPKQNYPSVLESML
ncbi:hypothetical protein JXC34_00625, partial [Candidatus Woesearchaeota archaeon]|nr:hypothetical protein [Candidatus Woesearchaeota archaeon]